MGGRSLGDGGPAEGAGLEGGRAVCRQECVQWMLQAGARRWSGSDMVHFSLVRQTKPCCLGSLVISVFYLRRCDFPAAGEGIEKWLQLLCSFSVHPSPSSLLASFSFLRALLAFADMSSLEAHVTQGRVCSSSTSSSSS